MAEQVLGLARHLISTTLTTIGSFMPLLILIGGDFWPPLAGGVGGATILAKNVIWLKEVLAVFNTFDFSFSKKI